MEKISYDYIKPLVSKEEIQGTQVLCQFTCPKTGKVVEASAYVNKTSNSQIKENFKRSLLYSIRSAISSLIYRLFGSFGTVGNIVGSATSSAANSVNVDTTQKISKKEKENAIVEAFKSVISNFYWDENEKRWLGKA